MSAHENGSTVVDPPRRTNHYLSLTERQALIEWILAHTTKLRDEKFTFASCARLAAKELGLDCNESHVRTITLNYLDDETTARRVNFVWDPRNRRSCAAGWLTKQNAAAAATADTTVLDRLSAVETTVESLQNSVHALTKRAADMAGLIEQMRSDLAIRTAVANASSAQPETQWVRENIELLFSEVSAIDTRVRSIQATLRSRETGSSSARLTSTNDKASDESSSAAAAQLLFASPVQSAPPVVRPLSQREVYAEHLRNTASRNTVLAWEQPLSPDDPDNFFFTITSFGVLHRGVALVLPPTASVGLPPAWWISVRIKSKRRFHRKHASNRQHIWDEVLKEMDTLLQQVGCQQCANAVRYRDLKTAHQNLNPPCNAFVESSATDCQYDVRYPVSVEEAEAMGLSSKQPCMSSKQWHQSMIWPLRIRAL